MLHKTKGIVLNYLKYRETSIIARIYTEQFGLQSYIINGVRSVRSKKGLALLQPLTVLEMVVYYKSNKVDDLQRMSEYKNVYHFQSIPFDIRKSTMALFVTELLSKTLKEESHHGEVFNFLTEFIQLLDQRTSGFESLHLYLMVQLTHYIGFGIHTANDLRNNEILGGFKTEVEKIYETILAFNESHLHDEMQVSGQVRKDVLAYLVQYYILHVEGFKEMKSLEVLSQLFR